MLAWGQRATKRTICVYTRRHLSVQLGPRRWHESAWCLLGFAGGNHADLAGFAMSSATRAASFPDIRVFMTPSSNSESHRHLGGSRWPTSAPDRRDGFRTRGGVFRSHRCSRRPRSLQDEMQKARRARLRLPSSPASQEPSRRATASQPHADSRLLQPYSVRA